ncbi:hypothetical protein BX600DRAFT_508346 [Xylariales sp. PMI_506]|nr:hypothetical protein BX600DRAFT_508346 [Xylariales sp. PMI_506]
MAMQTSSRPSTHGKTGSTGSAGSMQYGAPASPTLTNPDMILPDYDDSLISLHETESPMGMWINGQYNLGAQTYAPITPTTPIIYGNGTMLSDIGEVTEAESTTGLPIGTRNNYIHKHSVVRQSPNPVYQPVKKKSEPVLAPRDRERRLSMESTSTVTNGERAEMFADFDDSVSVDDSVFQGDDEESVAESYVYDDVHQTQSANQIEQALDLELKEQYSTALSRRAEQILANAKRRLTTMESNLNRARSSMSQHSDSTPSPSLAQPGSIPYEQGLAFPRGHNRISSENNIVAAPKSTAPFSPRSSSALGAAGGYRRTLQTSRSADFAREIPIETSPKGNSIFGNSGFAKSKTSLHDGLHTLEPLSEDEGLGLEETPSIPDDTRPDAFLSPTFGGYHDKGVRRSSSTTQIRDLKDQMAELKGRLSSLRDQARADTLKRRSLQSLRTPSPFTHATGYSNGDKNAAADSGSVKNVSRWSSDGSNTNEDDLSNQGDDIDKAGNRVSMISASVYSEQEDTLSPGLTSPDKNAAQMEWLEADENGDVVYDDDMRTEDGYQDHENAATDLEDIDYMSESGESLYHDSVQNQISHEDREDAFDYEHFFLHSAMGSMTQKRLRTRGSQESFSSEDSVETTRGPIANDTNSSSRGRRGSDASTSSAASFATATEGRSTRTEVENISDDYSEQVVHLPERARSHTPDTARRMTFGYGRFGGDSNGDQDQVHSPTQRRPQSSAATFNMHRPSVSSLGSIGTNRSFPLVNRPPKSTRSSGTSSSEGSSERGLKQISDTLLSETASICDNKSGEMQPMESLQKDDQILVERLVSSLGRCVLGLTEVGRASTESRVFRRRIEAARRILEGLEQPA